MKLNFPETIKRKTDIELEIISKDYSFYSTEERMLALKELESRNSLTNELRESKNRLEDSSKIDKEENEPKHRVSFIYLLPNKDYLFTPILIYINVLIFLLMVLAGISVFTPSIDSLLNWGGNLRFLTLNGQYWRLLTSVFLHAGILHLAFNMYALLYIGSVLEIAIGKTKFVLAYILSGIVASVSSIIINENIVSVGASGAIFGLFGVLLALLLFKEFKIKDVSKKSLLSSVGFFVFYNLIYGFGKTGIDNAAHIGGLFAGFIIGIVYYMTIKKRISNIVGYISLIFFFSFISAFALSHTSNNIGTFYNVMSEFSKNEEKALWMYKEDLSNISKDQLQFYRDKIYKDGVLIWEKNLSMLSDLSKIELPPNLQNRIILVNEYAELRKELCNTLIQMLGSPSDSLNNEMIKISKQIEDKLNELKK